MQRLLECSADRHGLAHRFHLGGQPGIRRGEFLKGKTGDLGHNVVDGRLEGRRRGATGDFITQLIQRKADRQLCGHLGNGKAGGLGSQRGGPRNARIHLDDHHAAVFRINGELDIGAARVHADFTQDGNRGIPQPLVLLVGQRQRRRHRDGVARVHAHGVDVFNGTDDDAVIDPVAHHLHFEFFPAKHRLLEQYLGGR